MKYIINIFSKKTSIYICTVMIISMMLIVSTGVYAFFTYTNYAVPVLSDLENCENKVSLIKDALDKIGASNPKVAASIWAQGVEYRNAYLQYGMMTNKLKEEYTKMIDKNFPYWVTGMSSPWINSYDIKETETDAGENVNRYKIKFDTITSTGPDKSYNATVDIVKEGEFYRIAKIYQDADFWPYTGYLK